MQNIDIRGEIFTVNHFVSEETSRNTIIDIINRFESKREQNTMLEVAVQSKF